MLPNPSIRVGSLVKLQGEDSERVGIVKDIHYTANSPYGKALVEVGSFTLDFPLERLELVVLKPDDLFE